MRGPENVKSLFQLKTRKQHTVRPIVLLTEEVSGTARFQFFMAVFMKDGVLTNVTPCTRVTFDGSLGGGLCLQYLSKRIPEDGSSNTFRNNRLHDFTS